MRQGSTSLASEDRLEHPCRGLLCRASFTCLLGTLLVPALLATALLVLLPLLVASAWAWLR
jgi:hypothetical protein